MKRLTFSNIKYLEPCEDYWKDDWALLRTLCVTHDPSGQGLTILNILQIGVIPAQDRIWLACRDGVMDPAIRRRWIDGVVARAVREHCLGCGVSAVETWAQRWLSGEDRTAAAAWAAEEEAWAARAAASWAAASAARAAASWAAASAARAARSAWKAAMWAAMWAASAASAARAAEYARQIADLTLLLEDSINKI